MDSYEIRDSANWVETQVKSGQYGNASDYVRDLIGRDYRIGEQVTLKVWRNREVREVREVIITLQGSL
ncbi:MAG: hypothetical protein QNL62_01745 [Gammaproteobacteria bacterium]|nr:hypothetical protein [Gammaproteobacteria bacterium]